MVQKQAIKLPTGVELNGGSLRIVFYQNGKRYRETLGIPPTKQNITFAKQKREAILYEIKIGNFNYAYHFPNSKHATGKPRSQELGELAEKYLEHKQHNIRSSTFRKYSTVLRTFISIYGSKRHCNTLSPRSLEQFRNDFASGRAARTVNRYLVTIKSFLTWLHRMEYVDKDFSEHLLRVKEYESDIRPFSINEFNQIIASFAQEQHRNIYTLFAYTGLRSGELCALAWEDVDFDKKTIVVRRSTYDKRGLKTTKTDKDRIVDLMPPAIEALKSQMKLTYLYPAKIYDVELPDKTYRKDSIRFVFNPKAVRHQKGSDYDYYCKHALGRTWRFHCKKAGVEHRNQYQLRHTYASWMITFANVNVSYLAQQMGHANITMIAKVYGKWLTEANKKESNRAWEELKKAHQI
ncbi:tyrosine-type recombinase/integrase [Vibrio algivorus]|uniref:Integrase n=1 Tax=Vibrio algivorus TaxID=1667024 RepID=A0ABQ6EL54_9VIBR|nr:tyrosine-type recombinase/integrase [Vibrio algivorus]GLT13858.1 integrase [Vibrio algivorus]